MHVRHKAKNPLWKGKHKGIFVFFVHCFHYFFNVHCNGEIVSVVQKSRKFSCDEVALKYDGKLF